MQNTAMYQPENAMLAMEAMRMIFGEQGDVSGWREALSQVKWEGRMEEILPDFYVDGAHNVSAVRMFVQSIQRDRREKVVLFSAVREKNYEEMIRILCQEKSVSEYVITLIEDKRAAQTEELKQIFQKYTDKPVVVKEELHQALTYLFSRKAGKAVYCLGSLYLDRNDKSDNRGGRVMLDYEKELKNFKPSLEVEEIEDAVYQEDLSDMTDLLKQVMDQKTK
mgnify:FL=1